MKSLFTEVFLLKDVFLCKGFLIIHGPYILGVSLFRRPSTKHAGGEGRGRLCPHGQYLSIIAVGAAGKSKKQSKSKGKAKPSKKQSKSKANGKAKAKQKAKPNQAKSKATNCFL